MKKIVLCTMAALVVSLVSPVTAQAEEAGAPAVPFASQADTVTADIVNMVDRMKTGTMSESQEGARAFEKLNQDAVAMGQGIMDAVQAKYPSGAGAFNYTQEDLFILAHVICGEAQSCPDEEQLYVGSVVLNRMNHPSFPNTVKGVVFQRGQYACTWDGNYNREPTPQNWANAQYLLENGSVLPGNVVWQSGGRQGSGVYIRTKYHCYCF